MKRTIIYTTLITFALFCGVAYTSCRKQADNQCINTVCQNNGICSEGHCICVNGYLGSHCETRGCEANFTGQVRFRNKSATGKTYSVIWDGAIIATVLPDSTSPYKIVDTNTHSFSITVYNTTTVACSDSTIKLKPCDTATYNCTY
ncbi:MAG: hypothetical protein JST82_05310 [Bacteroidetes bacterium]|nr:hypothetical protein [Bacteroidota bacterium]